MKPKITREQRRALIRQLTLNQMRSVGWDESKESAPVQYAAMVWREHEGLLQTGQMSNFEWNAEADRRYINDLADFVSKHSEINLDVIKQAHEELALAWERLIQIAGEVKAQRG